MRKYVSVLSSGMLIAGLSFWAMPAEASLLGGVKKVVKFTIAAPAVVIGATGAVMVAGSCLVIGAVYKDEIENTFAGKMSAKFQHK